MECLRRNNTLYLLQAIKHGGIKYTDLFSNGLSCERETMDELIKTYRYAYDIVIAIKNELNGYDELPFRAYIMLFEGLLDFVLHYTDEVEEEYDEMLLPKRVVRNNPLDLLRIENFPNILRAAKQGNLTYNDLFYGGPMYEKETMYFLINKYRGFLFAVIVRKLTNGISLSSRLEHILSCGIHSFIISYIKSLKN